MNVINDMDMSNYITWCYKMYYDFNAADRNVSSLKYSFSNAPIFDMQFLQIIYNRLYS